jgi:hypothetical protein
MLADLCDPPAKAGMTMSAKWCILGPTQAEEPDMRCGAKPGHLPIALLALFTAACGASERRAEPQTTPRACLEGIAAVALANPRTNPLAANFAGPLGLVASSAPDAAPYLSKQVEMPTPDGSVHYFAVDTARWVKAVLLRLVPAQGEPNVFLYVIDRDGTLIAAGLLKNRHFSTLNIRDAEVRANARIERRLWITAGRADACRSIS